MFMSFIVGLFLQRPAVIPPPSAAEPLHGRPPCQMAGGEQACQRFNHVYAQPPAAPATQPRGRR